MRELIHEPGVSTFGLTGCRLLEGLPADVAEELAHELEAVCDWAAYEEGQIVLDARSKLRDVYFIADGVVRIFHRLDGKREINFAEFRGGDAFGELSAIDGGGRTADAIATTPAIIAACPQDAFLKAMADHPPLALAVMRKLTGIIRHSDKRIADLAAMTGAQRVFDELLRLAMPDTDQPGAFIISPAPRHRDIAGWAGTETDVVARAIAHLMKSDLLVRRGSDLILADRDRIETLVRTRAEEE